MSSPFHMQEVDEDRPVLPQGASIPDEDRPDGVTFVDIGSIQMNPSTGTTHIVSCAFAPQLIEIICRLR